MKVELHVEGTFELYLSKKEVNFAEIPLVFLKIIVRPNDAYHRSQEGLATRFPTI